MRRKSWTAVLVTALLIIALAATALAVASRTGLFDFFAAWRADDIPQTPADFTQILTGEALLNAEYDDLIVTVTEVAGDGSTYYFNTTIELKPGVPSRLVNRDTPDPDALDAAIHAEDGLPVYFVRDYIYHGDVLCDSGDRRENADGSISSVNVIHLVEAADTARMGCYITYVRSEPGELPNETDTHTTMLPFEIPMPEPIDTRKMAEAISFEDLGITLDELYFKKMADATYCFTYIQYEGGEQVGYLLPRWPYGDKGLSLRITSEDGEQVLVPRLMSEWIADSYFYGYNALDMDTLPDRVVLELLDEDSGTVYGTAKVGLLPGGLETDRLARYRERPESMLDQRDMYFPWSDMSFVAEYAYLSTEDEAGVPVYLDPRDLDTLVGMYYSGLKVRPNITFGEWTSLHFGDWDRTSTQGYVKSELLVREPDEAHPGIPMARVTLPADESVDVHVRPTEVSTVNGSVAGQSEVFVIAATDGWFRIATEAGDSMRAIGFIPSDAAELTEKQVIMR